MYRKSKDSLSLIGKLLKTGGKLPPTQRIGVGLLTASSALLFSSTVMATQLAPPILSLPTEEMTVSPGTQTEFKWLGVTSANTYRLQVTSSPNFDISTDGKTCNNCVLNVKDGDETVAAKSSFTTTTPLSSGNYLWRVRAGHLTDPNLVASEWTTPRRLAVRLSAPQLSAPADRQGFTSLTPTLVWKEVPQATTYRVQIANASNFQTQVDGTNCSNCPVEYKVLEATSTYTVPAGKLVSGNYYWRVRAGSDTLVNSDWSSVYSFSILTLPVTVTPTTPVPVTPVSPPPPNTTGNTAPVYQQGSAEPAIVTVGNSVLFKSTWSDTEKNYIVDVVVRYRLQGIGEWKKLPLNYIGSCNNSPTNPSFSESTLLDVLGTYEYQFQAVDATPTPGTLPRLHDANNTAWQGSGIFTVVSSPEKKSSVYSLQRTTIGQPRNQEVRWTVKGVESDTKITLCINNLRTGKVTKPEKSVLLSQNYEVTHNFCQDGGEAIYAVAAVSKASDCDLDSVKNKAIVQIVGPETTDLSNSGCKKLEEKDSLYDVLVIDGTSAGIGAAYTAAKEGLKTCLLESTSLLGGMLTNGIGHTDISPYQFGGAVTPYLSYGLMDELRQRVEKILSSDVNKNDANKQFLLKKGDIGGLHYTPSVIRQAVYDLLLDSQQKLKLSITLESPFLSVKKDGNDYIVETSKGSYKGSYLVDATDSGDVAVALSEKLGKFKKDETGYCAYLNNRDFYSPKTEKDPNPKQVTQDDVPTDKEIPTKEIPTKEIPTKETPTKEIPTYCLRSPTQAYSFVMTLRQYDDVNQNWSYMNTLPPNCFGKKGPEGQVVGIEGQYTDDFFTDENNRWSVERGLMGVNPVIFQVKHHTTTDGYVPYTTTDKYASAASIGKEEKTIKCKTFVDELTTAEKDANRKKCGKDICLTAEEKDRNRKACGEDICDKSLGDELIDCNAHGVVGLPTGYAGESNDINRLPIVDRYLNHTMCFLYNMQHLDMDKKTPITDLVWLKKLELEWFKEQLKSKDAKKPPTLLAAEALTNSNSSTIGLAKEEDSTRGNFPARMYVREGRRINGLQTFTGKDAQSVYYDGNLVADKAKLDKAKPDKKAEALKAFNDAKAAVDKAVAANRPVNLVKTASDAVDKASKAVDEALISPDGLTYLKSHHINEKGRPDPEKLLREQGKEYSGNLSLENPKEKLKRSIAITTYGMDSHSTYLDESGDGEKPPSHMNLITGPGAVPFGVMVPRSLATTDNILVPLAASAGTWGQSVMRMEPTRLSMGRAAAVAIKIAKDRGINFQDFTNNEGAIFTLQRRLISEYGEKIYLYLDKEFYPENAEKHKDPEHMAAQFLGVWGIASGYGLDNGTPYLFGKKSKPKKEECKTMVDNANNQLFAGIPTIGELCSSTRGETAHGLYNAIVDAKGWEFFVKTDKQQPGKMQIISDSFRNTNLATIKVKVDGNLVTFTKEPDNIISLNTGATRENLKKPQTIVVDNNGKVFTTYYPFGDVPPGKPRAVSKSK